MRKPSEIPKSIDAYLPAIHIDKRSVHAKMRPLRPTNGRSEGQSLCGAHGIGFFLSGFQFCLTFFAFEVGTHDGQQTSCHAFNRIVGNAHAAAFQLRFLAFGVAIVAGEFVGQIIYLLPFCG